MREELRKQVPRIQTWYPAICISIVLAIVVAVVVLWFLLSSGSPAEVAESIVAAARANDTESIRQAIAEESRAAPELEEWLGYVEGALSLPGVEMTDENILGDEATVFLVVRHSTAPGVEAPLRMEMVRQRGDWKFDLKKSMGSQNLQMWLAVQGLRAGPTTGPSQPTGP